LIKRHALGENFFSHKKYLVYKENKKEKPETNKKCEKHFRYYIEEYSFGQKAFAFKGIGVSPLEIKNY